MLNKLLRARDGAVLAIVGLAIMVLVGSIGIAVDLGRGQMAQAKLQNAVDAAGLAAGASLSTTDLQAEVTKYMNVNFTQGTLGATITTITPVLNSDGTLLTVTANATMPTTFMQIFGENTMNLSAYTEVTRSQKGMELSVVLDVTGSMCMPCTKIDALKTAAHDLIDILFGEGNNTAENLWIGIVPFSMGVNVGTSHQAWFDPSPDTYDWGDSSWRGCAEARWETGRDLTEDTPTTEAFIPYYAADNDSYNDWIQPVTNSTKTCNNQSSCTCSNYGPCSCTQNGNISTCKRCTGSGSTRKCYTDVTQPTYVISSSKGPNVNCPTNPITPLTNNRPTLDNAIDALTTGGGTHIPVGAVWGWRLISQSWRGFWGGSMDTNLLPLDYGTDRMIKAMIIMTDGENTMYNTADGAYGLSSQNEVGMTSTPYTDAKAAAKLDDKLKTICDNMQAKNILVYVVVFDVADANVKSQVKGCASQPDYYFNAPDSAALKQAFRTIGDSLANLRISK
jgi:Flp pilus assembly protein TadG